MSTDRSTSILSTLFVRELRSLAQELEMFPDEASMWGTLPGVTNSAGTIALHLCGNLQHYVGHVLGGTSFVRDRDAEFSRRDVPRADILREIETTIGVVSTIMPTITDEMLERPYPELIAGMTVNTNTFLHHLSAHLAMHLGQAGYLRRILGQDARSAGPVPVKALTNA